MLLKNTPFLAPKTFYGVLYHRASINASERLKSGKESIFMKFKELLPWLMVFLAIVLSLVIGFLLFPLMKVYGFIVGFIVLYFLVRVIENIF